MAETQEIRYAKSGDRHAASQILGEGPIVPLIHTPTLLLHRVDNPLLRIGQGRYLAENIAARRPLTTSSCRQCHARPSRRQTDFARMVTPPDGGVNRCSAYDRSFLGNQPPQEEA